MQKCFLAVSVFFIIVSLELFAQRPPADRCVRDSLFLVKPHENMVQEAKIYLELAELIKNDLPVKSFSYVVSAFRIAILEKNDSLKAKTRMMMGSYYSGKRDFMHAQEQFMAARKSYRLIRDSIGEMEALSRIGYINRILDNHDKSLSYLLKGLPLVEGTKANLISAMLLEQIGLTYQAKGYVDSAMYYYKRALALSREAGGRENEFHVQNNIGNLYLSEGKNDKALSCFTALLMDADTSDGQLMGVLYTRIGHIYSLKNDHRTSLRYNQKALIARKHSHVQSDQASSLINIAGDFYNLGKPELGKRYMDSGLVLARKYRRTDLIENGFYHLYAYYRSAGNYVEALNWYGRYSNLHDENIVEKHTNNVSILEAQEKLQRIQKEWEIKARRHDLLSLKLMFHDYQSAILKILVGLAGISILGFVFWLLYIRRVRRKMQDLNIRLTDEIREREAAEAQTRERENQYRFLTENSNDFITQMDAQKNRIYASPSSINVYGYTPEEIVTKSSFDLTHPDHYAFTESKFGEMVAARSSQQFIHLARKKDGTFFWVESIFNPLFDPISGVFKGMVGVIRDIQERKAKETEIMEGTKQTENLLKEIHHRVKNNFAILVSLINMQMAQTKNPELMQSLTNLQLRIRTMALVHEMLYRSSDFEKISFPGYLRSLASVIAGTYNRRDIELIIDAEEVVMDIEASIPLGLIVNEMLGNAYKHAFPAERQGKIVLRFTLDDKSGINTLAVQDDGIGMPNQGSLDNCKTMGLQVVQILCNQIEAKLEVTNNPGASFTITFQGPGK